MSWWSRLKLILCGALGLHYRLLKCRVIKLRLLRKSRPVRISPFAKSVTKSFSYLLQSLVKNVEAALLAGPIRHITSARPRHTRVPTELDVWLTKLAAVDPCPDSVVRIGCAPAIPDPGAIPCMDVGIGSCHTLEYRVLAPSAQHGLPEPPQSGPAIRADLCKEKAVRHSVDLINRIPLAIKPSRWGTLDREFILACWELIKGQAFEELSYDPGRALEMSAIFPDVDMQGFERTEFNPKTRELLLYPKRSSTDSRPDTRHYAIIIGTVKGLNKLLKAALPIDPDCD